MTVKKFVTLTVIAGVLYALGSRVARWSSETATSTKKAAKRSSKSFDALRKHETPKSAKRDRDDAANTSIGARATLSIAKAYRDANKKRDFGLGR